MWYIIWCLTGKEEELVERIREVIPETMYKDVWTPYKIVISNMHGVEEKKKILMFPGYVFIETGDIEELHLLLKQESSYIGVLKSGDKAVPVTEADRRIIEFFTSNKGVAGVSLGIKENGRVKILEGPLKGMDDKIVKVKRNKKKAWVRLEDFLGQDREISFALEIVDKD